MYENLPDLLTSEEACEYLRVTPLSLYSYIKAGKLRAFRVGKRYRVPKDALIAFLEGRTVEAAAPAPPADAKKGAAAAKKVPVGNTDKVAEKVQEIFGKKK